MMPRILIVEDEAALTLMLRYNLEAARYAVDTATRGDEAEVKLRESPPDLLILDWMLPGVSGIEICRRLRARAQILSGRDRGPRHRRAAQVSRRAGAPRALCRDLQRRARPLGRPGRGGGSPPRPSARPVRVSRTSRGGREREARRSL